MTFKPKLSCRLALLRDALPAAIVLLGACELSRTVSVDGEPTALVVLPSRVSVQPNQTVDFLAVAVEADGDTVDADVTWTATGGTMVDTGTTNGKKYGRYKAGADTGTKHVIVRKRGANIADTATVMVTLASVASVTVTPAGARSLWRRARPRRSRRRALRTGRARSSRPRSPAMRRGCPSP